MPKYYFYLENEHPVSDPDGTELPDLDAVREHATGVARELTFRRDSMLDRPWSHWTMSVRDSSGQEVLSFGLADDRNAGSGNGSQTANSPLRPRKKPNS